MIRVSSDEKPLYSRAIATLPRQVAKFLNLSSIIIAKHLPYPEKVEAFAEARSHH